MSNLTVRDADAWDWNGIRDKVVELTAMGYGPSYVAKATGVSLTTVEKIKRTEFQERNANRQSIIEAHSQTVNWLKLKITERIANAKDKWDRRDGELLLKLLEREAKLFGCDQPTQHQHDVNVVVENLTDDDLLKQLAAEGYVFQLPPSPPAPLSLPEPIQDAEFVKIDAQPQQQPATPPQD